MCFVYQLVISLSILVFCLIYCHTQTFFFAFSHYLSLSFSVTLNVILYFTNLRPLLLLLLLNLSPVTLQMCAFVCFCKFFVFPFSPSWIRQECVSVFDLLSLSLCWLLFVKHTFNSSILYCNCFPFFLFVSISRAHARTCKCVPYLL